MADNKALEEVAEGGQMSTPGAKGDKKREATSPLLPETALQEKKTRHDSENSTSSQSHMDALQGTVNEMSVDPDPDTEGSAHIHLLSQPLFPNDILQIATELRSMMMPEIKSVVHDAVKEATQSLRDEIKNLTSENDQLKNANNALEKRLTVMENENDNLEQYSRRNTLRISGIPEETDEETDSIVLHLASNLGVDLSDSDIDRSHRVGKFNDRERADEAPRARRRDRDIIVKFARYNARNKLYQKRKELRSIPVMTSIFINEDLTKKRSKLLFNARILARAKLLKAAYSSDGKIFVRDAEDTRYLIKCDSDISKFGDVEEAKKTDRKNARYSVSLAVYQ